MPRTICFLIKSLLFVQLLSIPGTAVADEDFFENQVRPILVERCVRCHGEKKQSGELRLDSAESLRHAGESGQLAVVPGKVSQSLLVQAIRYSDDLQMPPEEQLPESEIQTLEAWIAGGATWPVNAAPLIADQADSATNHWAFQPISNPEIPTISGEVFDSAGTFFQNPIDAFIGAKLIASGLPHSPPADRRTLIRRLTY
ncbi:MAG: hypothetical protein KDA85_17670, partial [Planctomycetaceae bacterium]|nr:hypothetical protein [Planctomycetaceae bacterium]